VLQNTKQNNEEIHKFQQKNTRNPVCMFLRGSQINLNTDIICSMNVAVEDKQPRVPKVIYNKFKMIDGMSHG
jgi:hypothetical protein